MDFRPSARLQIALRLEEFDDEGNLITALRAASQQPAPAPQPTAVASTPSPQSQQQLERDLAAIDEQITLIRQDESLSIEERDTSLAIYEARRSETVSQLTQQSQQAQDPPPTIAGPPPDDRVVLGNIVPKSVQIERNGIRTADQCTITLAHADAPFDSRLIRAAAVEVTIGVVSASDFERGMLGETYDGMPTSVVPRSRTLIGPGSRAAWTTRFVGWVDDWKITYDGTDGDTIELVCRDLSALFFDVPLATGSGIDLSLPITQGVQAFIASYNELRGIPVLYGRPGDLDPGTPPIPLEAVPPASRARRGRVARQQRSGDQRQSVWDHIVETCARVGLVPIVFDYELHICEPRTFFVGRDVPRRMVYGRNLSHLEFSRKIGGVKVPTIEVRCYDPMLGRTRWARWPASPGEGVGIFGERNPPTTPNRANEPGVSGHAASERIQTYLVRGVTDPVLLQRVARNLFEQIGRQEIEGNFETFDVTSYTEEQFPDPDVLSLDSGDAVELLVSGGPRVPDAQGMTAATIEALSRESRAQYLRSIGWSQRVAQRFAELQDATANQTVFRTQNVRLNWDNDQGFKATVDFINFIVAREEPGPSAQDEAGAIVSDDQGLPPDIAQITQGRTDESANRLRDFYRMRQETTDRFEAGSLSAADYEATMAAIDEQIPGAIADVSSGSGAS